MQIAGTLDYANRPPVALSKRRSLMAACLAHALHDGYTDGLYAFLPVWQTQFGLSYAGLAVVRALYYGTMGGLQVPGDKLVRALWPRAALVLSTAVAATSFLVTALPLGFAGLCFGLVMAGVGSSIQRPRGSLLVTDTYAPESRGALGWIARMLNPVPLEPGRATGGRWRRRSFIWTEALLPRRGSKSRAAADERTRRKARPLPRPATLETLAPRARQRRTSEDAMFDPASLAQSWPAPSRPRPIVTIGAGSIVADAHFPAWRKAGFEIAGVYDLDPVRARAVAQRFGVERVFTSLDEALAVEDALFDLATPPAAHAAVLRRLPRGGPVLIQKPMGANLAQATEILMVCRERELEAAVNFQLRFAPMMLAVRDALARRLLGRLVDVEVHLAIDTPWHLFAFLKGLPRVEIAVHSIHYLDLIRGFLGDPSGVHAKTLGHPASDMAQTRATAILDYGSEVRCALSINHNHAFGRKFQAAEIRFDGTEGAALARLGGLLNYPKGEPDELWIKAKGDSDWVEAPLQGAWFPDAFVGRMANLQRFAAGEDAELVASVEDAWTTMALVEAAFDSSARPATPLAAKP